MGAAMKEKKSEWVAVSLISNSHDVSLLEFSHQKSQEAQTKPAYGLTLSIRDEGDKIEMQN